MKLKLTIVLLILTMAAAIFQPDSVIGNSMDREDVFEEQEILEEKEKYKETHYVDLDNDGISERIEIVRKATTPGYISYYIYDSLTETLLFSKVDIYRGVIDIGDDRIIEKIPIYNKDEFRSEIGYEEKEYILQDGTVVCINSDIKEDLPIIRNFSNKSYSNPSRLEIENMIDEVALDRGIPPTILKAIAYTESNYRQFDGNGEPLRSFDDVSWGIMQVTPTIDGDLDIERLKYDIRYNIEAGANILLEKWAYGFGVSRLIPIIGTGDMRVLENWYFAIWAYNGFIKTNNPNLMPYDHNTWIQYETYQDKVLRYAKEILNQNIVAISKESLPKDGIPDPNMHFNELESSKEDKYRLFVKNQKVKVNVKSGINLRNDNMEFIKLINNGENLRIESSSRLYNGHWYYKVEELYENGGIGQTGWVVSNWIIPNDKLNIGYQVWQKKIDVDEDKVWTIKLNLPVKDNFEMKDRIYIEDSRFNRIDIEIDYEEDNLDTLKVSPKNKLKAGEEYTLYIKGLETDRGNLLNENVMIKFNVKF